MFACTCTYVYVFIERFKQSYYSYIENAVEWLRACLGCELFSLIVPILRHVSFFRLGLISFYFPPPLVRRETWTGDGESVRGRCRRAYGSKCERVQQRYTHRTYIHAPSPRAATTPENATVAAVFVWRPRAPRGRPPPARSTLRRSQLRPESAVAQLSTQTPIQYLALHPPCSPISVLPQSDAALT